MLIVGLGSIGMLYDLESSDQAHVLSHAKAFSQHENFVLVAGVDPDPIARKKFSDKYSAWSGHDLAEALRISCPDVVVLASPTNTHAETLKSILAHAKPKVVLCEKPISYSLQEAQFMVSACRDANCLFFVNYLRRVEPGVVEIKRRLVVGEIRGAEVIDMLAALNTGHSGSMSTCHAHSASQALGRIESLMLQHCPQWTREIIRDHIGSAIDLVVHVTRNAAGQRRISEIVEVPQPFTGSVSVVWNSTQQQLPRRQRLAS